MRLLSILRDYINIAECANALNLRADKHKKTIQWFLLVVDGNALKLLPMDILSFLRICFAPRNVQTTPPTRRTYALLQILTRTRTALSRYPRNHCHRRTPTPKWQP